MLILVWVQEVEGELGFTEVNYFSWHAWLMTLAFPVFMTEALLSFVNPILHPSLLARDFERQRRFVKIGHAVLHVLTLICIVLGLTTIVFYKRDAGAPVVFPNYTLFSPHSWIGAVTLALWTVQFAAGIIAAAVPAWRGLLARLHPLLGKSVFVLGLATCALGLQDMQSSDLSTDSYGTYSTFSLLASAASIVLIALNFFVFAAFEFRPKMHAEVGDPKI